MNPSGAIRILWLAVFGFAALRLAADGSHPVVDRWLSAMTNITTWRARVTQTRHLKALTRPLTAEGRVWFSAPDSFRWELGDPPQSIVLRAGDTLTLLSPKLRRAETMSMAQDSRGPAGDLTALLNAGFPRDAADFHKRFELVEAMTNGPTYTLRLRPQSSSARRMMPSIAIELESAGLQLQATEMTFADGSRLRNAFADVVTNAPLSSDLFHTNLDSSWKVVSPGGGR